MRLLLSRKWGGQGGEQVSRTDSSNRKSSSSSSSSTAGASQDAKLSSCPSASYGVDLDRIDSRLNVNICVGVARGGGRTKEQINKETHRRSEREKQSRRDQWEAT